MHMHDIHSCAQLGSENEKLKKTLRRVKRENEEMKRKINAFEEQRKMETMLKQFVTTRNMESQTDPMRSYATAASMIQQQQQAARKVDNNQQQDKLNKMLLMHNNLLRRYEKELKTNMAHVETITELNLEINTLQQKLKEHEIQVHLRAGASASKQRSRQPRSHAPHKSVHVEAGDEEDDEDGADTPILYKYHCLRKERDKLKKDNTKLKQEMKGLDHGFFEEVEDLKFALHQSGLLNQEYERSLRKHCKQFGVPYPNPEKKLPRQAAKS